MRNAMIRTFFICIRPLGWMSTKPSARSTSVGTTTPPVLLVVGSPLNSSALSLVKLFLRSREWHWLWSVSCGGGSLAEQSKRIEQRVDALIERAQTPKIDIVAHGGAGLAVAWYLRHGQKHQKVRRLVTLGTPWRGTYMAVLGKNRDHAKEAHPSSPSLDQLQDLPVHTVSIWSQSDYEIVPSQSAAPPWLTAVELEGAGHLDLLTSPRALRAIQTALESPATGTK